MQDIRFICLDTETTGLRVSDGDRIIEIGMVEVVNLEQTRTYQSYFKYDGKLSEIVKNITKISDEMLIGKPDFSQKAKEIMDFLQKDANGNESPAILVIHNAKFDLSFLNFQLNEAIGINLNHLTAVDTMDVMRRNFPGIKLTLDSLCEKYNIDLSIRESEGHGALLDSKLLASAFISLIRDGAKIFKEDTKTEFNIIKRDKVLESRTLYKISDTEIAQHNEMLKELNTESW